MPGGEQAVKIGADGEKMMQEFLKLIGWNHISSNVTFDCTKGKKHKLKKSTSEKKNHNIDATFFYGSPLNHNETDIVLCSSKHNQDAYSDRTKAYAHLKELAYSLECAPEDYSFVNKFDNGDTKKKTYKGLLFWVSSNKSEQNESIISTISSDLIEDDEQQSETIGKLRGINFDTIYFVDNHKATFIASAIDTAQKAHPKQKIQFLYPDTGSNNKAEDISAYGTIMPIQYVNSSLLPIVVNDGATISVLIFCDSEFDKDYLKRIIWLAHKVCELAGKVTVYFSDYDKTVNEEDATRVKQQFQKSNFANKIELKQTQVFNFVTLKEDQNNEDYAVNTTIALRKKQDQLIGQNILPQEEDIDKVLPFGAMMKPIISSTSLSETDLKSFLIRKGIYIGNKEKQNTVPLLSTLLLSPKELNDLKYLLKAKEDRVKSVPRTIEIGTHNPTTKELGNFVHKGLEDVDKMRLPSNCIFANKPKVTEDDDEIRVIFSLEKQNTTKDLITGKIHSEGAIVYKKATKEILGHIDYTSPETYIVGTSIFKKVEQVLFDNKVIADTFASIQFDSFNNLERIDFFLSFLILKGNMIFSNPKLEYILIKPDKTLPRKLPFDLESLKTKVNHLAITGQELESVHLFDKDYKTCLLMQKVKIKYDFDYSRERGKCIVELDFRQALSGVSDADLNFHLDIIKSSTVKGKDNSTVLNKLRKGFNEVLQKHFKESMDATKVIALPPLPEDNEGGMVG